MQFQSSILCTWAVVNPAETLEDRKVWVLPTGDSDTRDYDIQDAKFLGTVQQARGQLVWHVFVEEK